MYNEHPPDKSSVSGLVGCIMGIVCTHACTACTQNQDTRHAAYMRTCLPVMVAASLLCAGAAAGAAVALNFCETHLSARTGDMFDNITIALSNIERERQQKVHDSPPVGDRSIGAQGCSDGKAIMQHNSLFDAS